MTPDTAGPALVALMGAPNIASKRWVFEQYDTEVRTNTVAGPGPTDAAVVRLKGTATRAPEPVAARPPGVKGPVSPGTGERGLAMSTDCNGRYVYLNPRRGAKIAVAEAARNVVCAGGEPLAVTNCLNFGNPYKPEVYWQFTEAVGGMGDACRALGTPVTGGNVSFYNENPDGAIFPTPTIGMVGLVEDVDRDATTAAFRAPGDAILLVSPAAWWHTGGIEASEYLHTRHDRTAGDAPHLDLDEEKAVHATVLAAIRAGLVKSAHDCADGGLAVALAESCLHGGFGASVALPAVDARLDAVLFGEAQSRVVLSVPYERATEVEALAARHGARVTTLGTVGLSRLSIAVGGTTVIDEAVADLKRPYDSSIPDAMGEPVAAL